MDPRSRFRRATALCAISAILAVSGCGGSSSSSSGSDSVPNVPTTRITHPVRADEPIIEVSAGGGLAPDTARVRDTVPLVWISGAGRALVARSTGTDVPALPVLREHRLSEAALQRLLRAASEAGLLAADPDYGTPKIFDAVNTRILVAAGGQRHDVLALALGYPVSDLDPATVAARARLSRFVRLAQHPRRLDTAGSPREFALSALAVFVLGPATTSSTDGAPTWPLADLATVGDPMTWPTPSTRCFVVRGTELDAVAAAAAPATWSTPWRSGGTLWEVAIRPLLPDEQTCADVVTPPTI